MFWNVDGSPAPLLPSPLPRGAPEASHAAITRSWDFYGEPADNGERLGPTKYQVFR